MLFIDKKEIRCVYIYRLINGYNNTCICFSNNIYMCGKCEIRENSREQTEEIKKIFL